MKILWVKAGKILPVDTGGKIRSYNILKRLSEQYEVTFLSYYGGRRDETYEQQIVHDLPGSIPLCTAAWDSTALHRGLDYLRRFPSGLPFAISKFTSVKVQRKIDLLMHEHRFDVAVCDFLAASLNFPAAPPTPTVLFQHNIESLLWRRQADAEKNAFKRRVFQTEAARMEQYERKAIRRFQGIIAVSKQDCERMKGWTDPSHITVIPTGVDLKQYCPDPAVKTSPFLALFIGSMDWEANIDGVEYFCKEIWPRVRAHVPQARFRIVGRNPSTRVRKLAGDAVEVTGTVPSVVDHLREAALVVVPLRVGGGTRLKIPEAMAVGKAVVSTSIGAEGLEVTPGRDIIICDEPADFASSVVALLEDTELRHKYEQAALDFAAGYDWSVIAVRFAEALRKVANGSTSAPVLSERRSD